MIDCLRTRQLGGLCEIVYNNLNWDKAKQSLLNAVYVAFATRYMKRTKLALIGYQAPGFVDFHPNPFQMCRQFGSILQQVGMTEYIATALHTITEEEVAADIAKVKELNLPFKAVDTGFGVEEHELSQASRHYLAMKKYIYDDNFDALAIRCWPELPGPQVCDQLYFELYIYLCHKNTPLTSFLVLLTVLLFFSPSF